MTPARARVLAATTLALAGVVGGVHAMGGCGGGAPFCGDGETDLGEQCDDGNDDETDFCRMCFIYSPPRTTIKWALNDDPTSGFMGDACIDLGVMQMQVDMQGPEPATMSTRCSDDQVVFQELTPGEYTVALTPFDNAMQSMVTAPVTAPVTVVAMNSELTVIVPYTAWNRPFTGTYQFRFTWGGSTTCTGAMPPVVTQVLTLLVNGVPVTQLTDTGQRLDGTDPQACRPSTDQHRVLALPLGPATLIVEGRDSAGVAQYNQTFDSFVGAGAGNPTWDYDVPGPDAAPPPDAAPMPDAAPPDAAVPDAAVPDAAVPDAL